MQWVDRHGRMLAAFCRRPEAAHSLAARGKDREQTVRKMQLIRVEVDEQLLDEHGAL